MSLNGNKELKGWTNFKDLRIVFTQKCIKVKKEQAHIYKILNVGRKDQD